MAEWRPYDSSAIDCVELKKTEVSLIGRPPFVDTGFPSTDDQAPIYINIFVSMKTIFHHIAAVAREKPDDMKYKDRPAYLSDLNF
ncbi:hypothetical protein CEXT_737291 [Caerostris extrusa]|uniref:Uncharacterized protein n=1 Tax=Caerostris extrusa TaxID=172846 RepID=A0AAV4WTN9_CAEEX|nr:hypothetical protein CEXT_737291 [Caerostris extrusa]